jgi:hypothetical protein
MLLQNRGAKTPHMTLYKKQETDLDLGQLMPLPLSLEGSFLNM